MKANISEIGKVFPTPSEKRSQCNMRGQGAVEKRERMNLSKTFIAFQN